MRESGTARHGARLLVGLVVLAVPACDRAPVSPSPVTAGLSFTFSVSPLDVTQIRSIQRMVHRPNRSFPYIQMTYAVPGDIVRAPADALVTAVTATASAVRIDFTTTSGAKYYLTDLASVGVGVGERVAAGQGIGTVGPIDGLLPSVGFGVIGPGTTQPFITPARYPDDWLHAASPIRYAESPLRELLAADMQPPGLGEGKLCFDIPGALQGFWYLESVPAPESVNEEYRGARLWFYYNDLNPDERVVTYSGQGLTLSGSRIRDDDPVAAQVTVSSGVVRFRFVRRVGEFPDRRDHDFVLVVEMLSADRLRAEAFDTTLTPEPAFTGAARIYVR